MDYIRILYQSGRFDTNKEKEWQDFMMIKTSLAKVWYDYDRLSYLVESLDSIYYRN